MHVAFKPVGVKGKVDWVPLGQYMFSGDEISAHIEDLFLWMTLMILLTGRSSSLESSQASVYLFSKDRQRHFVIGLLGLVLSNGRVWSIRACFCADLRSDAQIFLEKKPKNQTTQKTKETSLGIIVYPVDSRHQS